MVDDQQPVEPENLDDFDDSEIGAGQELQPADGGGAGQVEPRQKSKMTERLSKTTRMVGEVKNQSPPKFWLLAGSAGIALFILIIVVVWISSKNAQRPQVRAPNFSTNVGIDQDSSSRIQSFIAAQERKYAELEESIERQSREYESSRAANQRLIDNLRESRERAQAQAAQARADMEEATALLREAINRPAAMVVGGGRGDSSGAQVQSYDAFVRSLREQYAENLLSASDARARIRQRLIQQDGYNEEGIEPIVESIMERLGIRFIGNVAEPPPRSDEIARLPEALQAIFPEVSGFIFNKGAVEGKVLVRPEEVRRLVSSRLPNFEMSDEQLNQLALLSRIRLENVSGRMEEQLGRLVALRDSRGIPADDLERIESLVWEQRVSLTGMTPGMHLALIGAIARLKGSAAVPGSRSSQRQATQDDADVARLRVRRALEQHLASGNRDQAALIAGARAALQAFLDDGGISMANNMRDQLILVEVRRVLMGESSEQPESAAAARVVPAQPGPDRSREAPASTGEPAPVLHLGPLQIDRPASGRIARFMVPFVADQMGLDPSTPFGAAGITAMLVNADRIGQDQYPRFVGQPLGARGWADEVVRSLIEHGFDGAALARTGIDLPGIKDDRVGLVRAIVASDRLGRLLGDPERLADGFRLLDETSRRPGGLLGKDQVDRLNAIDLGGPEWGVLLSFQEAISIPSNAAIYARIRGLKEPLDQVIASAITFGETVRTDARLGSIAATVGNDLVTIAPTLGATLFAMLDDGRMSADEVASRVDHEQRRFFTLLVAEAVVMHRVTSSLVRPYISQVNEEGGGLSAVLGKLRDGSPDLLRSALEAQKPRIGDDNIIDVGTMLADRVMDPIEAMMVRQVVLTNVEPRVIRAGRTFERSAVVEALTFARSEAEILVEAPFTVSRVNDWIMTLQEESIAVLEGQRVPRRGAAREAQQQSAAAGPRVAFPPVIPPRLGANRQALGTRQEVSQGRHVVLSSGTYANGVITTGVSAEVGGEGNIPILIEMPMTFHGPGGGLIHLPNVRFIGQANPRAGAERLSIQLRRLSYRFPNGRAVDYDINGYVADNIDGMEGALGTFRLHADKVLPAALGAGFLSGVGEALNNSATSVEVTSGGTTTTTSTGSTLERAVIGGASEGASIIADYVRTYMDDIRPTVSAPNGQPVTVILLDPVVFNDVSEEEWQSLRVQSSEYGF